MPIPFRPLAALLLIAAATPVVAQDIDRRIGKLESEMKAVQRKVFPGGNKQYFEPEVAPVAPPPMTVGAPATSPIADLTTRVDALERQLQSITGQVEQANFRARQAEEGLAKFRADTEFRLTQLEGGAPAPGAAAAATPAAGAPPFAAPPPKTAAAIPLKPAAKPAADTDTPVAAKPADPIEAEYQAAYSLYQNKRYGEAQTALAAFAAKRPKSKFASPAQYWLGRSYLSDNQPAPAAKAFLDNYRNMPTGTRAADSLIWLGQALMAMSPANPAKACEVYDEAKTAYGAKLTAVQLTQLAKGRAAAKCAP